MLTREQVNQSIRLDNAAKMARLYQKLKRIGKINQFGEFTGTAHELDIYIKETESC
jgi:hypothetical protein